MVNTRNAYRYLREEAALPAETIVFRDPGGLVWRALAVPRGGVKLVVPDVLAAVRGDCKLVPHGPGRGGEAKQRQRTGVVLQSAKRSVE